MYSTKDNANTVVPHNVWHTLSSQCFVILSLLAMLTVLRKCLILASFA